MLDVASTITSSNDAGMEGAWSSLMETVELNALKLIDLWEAVVVDAPVLQVTLEDILVSTVLCLEISRGSFPN